MSRRRREDGVVRELFLVVVALPMKGTRCGEKRSMWRDDVTAARCPTREGAEAVVRLLGEGEIYRVPWPPPQPDRDNCGCSWRFRPGGSAKTRRSTSS